MLVIGHQRTLMRILLRLYRRAHNVVSLATGRGLTRNVIDCYAATIRMWDPAIAILLFGFSRGGLHRSLLGWRACILRRADTDAGRRSGAPRPENVEAIAREAVMKVYQRTASVNPD